jgi:nucleoside-diphosphate-sugar epimerase
MGGRNQVCVPIRRLFITGATGFVGCRVAEVAIQRGIPIVALVRRWTGAPRLARLPVEMVGGDVLQFESLRRAMKGSDVVVHCAVDYSLSGRNQRNALAQGAENVMRAAVQLGVRRVVHISSVAVYGYSPNLRRCDESTPYRYTGDGYCDGKIDTEKIAERYWNKHQLAVTILRPTIVYGPFGFYSFDVSDSIRRGTMVLIDGARGTCNTLYIDNLVSAILLAVEQEDAGVEIFHISDRSPITWKDFVEAHAGALSDRYLPLPQMSREELARRRKQKPHGTSSCQQVIAILRDPRTLSALRTIPAVNRIVHFGASCLAGYVAPQKRQLVLKRLFSGSASKIDAGGDTSPPEGLTDLLTSQVIFPIDKAIRLLGYDPAVSFSEGMARTAAWMNWAGL